MELRSQILTPTGPQKDPGSGSTPGPWGDDGPQPAPNATASALALGLHRGSQGSVLPRPGPVAHCTTCSAWAFQLCMHRVAPRPMQQRRVPGGVRHYGGRPRHRPLLKN
ncbi:unnamed protein product [Gadus morhua 'NCC']